MRGRASGPTIAPPPPPPIPNADPLSCGGNVRLVARESASAWVPGSRSPERAAARPLVRLPRATRAGAVPQLSPNCPRRASTPVASRRLTPRGSRCLCAFGRRFAMVVRWASQLRIPLGTPLLATPMVTYRLSGPGLPIRPHELGCGGEPLSACSPLLPIHRLQPTPRGAAGWRGLRR